MRSDGSRRSVGCSASLKEMTLARIGQNNAGSINPVLMPSLNGAGGLLTSVGVVGSTSGSSAGSSKPLLVPCALENLTFTPLNTKAGSMAVAAGVTSTRACPGEPSAAGSGPLNFAPERAQLILRNNRSSNAWPEYQAATG